MLSFQEFFTACAGFWTTERTYHHLSTGEIERSYTEFQVDILTLAERQKIFTTSLLPSRSETAQIDSTRLEECPGFAISFDTRSETGEQVSMSLQALFIPDQCFTVVPDLEILRSPVPVAAQVPAEPREEVIQGFYLRNKGYSEAGAIAGRFTYQTIRRTLEMTTYYQRSIAVDQMRIIAPQVRLRTIVTYQRPQDDPTQTPSMIDLIGFGVERKQA